MLDTSFSWILWIAIVLIQAIIHFGIIEPRSKKRKEEKQRSLEPRVSESILRTANGSGREIHSRSTSDQDVVSLTRSIKESNNNKHLKLISGSKAQSIENDPDETDTSDCAKMEQQHLNQTNYRRSISRQDSDNSSTVNSRSMLNDKDPVHSSSLCQSESHSRMIGITKTENEDSQEKKFSDRFDESGSRESSSSSFAQGETCEKNYPSYDDDEDSYSNEDDEWRNSLVQYYYSPASPSLIKMASQRAISCYDDMEEEEDPATQAVEPSSGISSKPSVSSHSIRSMESRSPLQKGIIKSTSSNSNRTSHEEREGTMTNERAKQVLFSDEISSKSYFISTLAPMVCT